MVPAFAITRIVVATTSIVLAATCPSVSQQTRPTTSVTTSSYFPTAPLTLPRSVAAPASATPPATPVQAPPASAPPPAPPVVGAPVGQGDDFAAAISALVGIPGSGVRQVSGAPVVPAVGTAIQVAPPAAIPVPVPAPAPEAAEPVVEVPRVRRF